MNKINSKISETVDLKQLKQCTVLIYSITSIYSKYFIDFIYKSLKTEVKFKEEKYEEQQYTKQDQHYNYTYTNGYDKTYQTSITKIFNENNHSVGEMYYMETICFSFDEKHRKRCVTLKIFSVNRKKVLVTYNSTSSERMKHNDSNLKINTKDILTVKDGTCRSQNITKLATERKGTEHGKQIIASRGKHKVKTKTNRLASKRYRMQILWDHETTNTDINTKIQHFVECGISQFKLLNPYFQVPTVGSQILWPSGHALLPFKQRFILETSHDNDYTKRLRSFLLKENKRQINWSDDRVVRPEPLINAGFIYEGNEDEVVCEKCGCKSRTEEWSDDDDDYAESVHRKANPNCVFLTNQSKQDVSQKERQDETKHFKSPQRKRSERSGGEVTTCRSDNSCENTGGISTQYEIDDVCSVEKGNTFVPYD